MQSVSNFDALQNFESIRSKRGKNKLFAYDQSQIFRYVPHTYCAGGLYTFSGTNISIIDKMMSNLEYKVISHLLKFEN
jgi:hypothetical protein